MASFSDDQGSRLLKETLEKEQEDVAKILASRYGFSYIDLSTLRIDPAALALTNEDTAKEGRFVPFRKEGKYIHIASEKADNDQIRGALSTIEQLGYTPVRYLASAKSIDKGLGHYDDLRSNVSVRKGEFDLASHKIDEIARTIQTVTDATHLIGDMEGSRSRYRLTEILEVILASSLSLDASDIHLEPENKSARIRMRVQGVLRDVGRVGETTHRYLLSRIKLLSGAKLNITKKPQDGRFSIVVQERAIEVRVSIIPEAEGESVVLRMLDPDKGEIGLDTLGMPSRLIEHIRQEIRRPNGMILTTGPTGSGKTTALYALMREMYTPEIKIITIENPVEYRLPGITQTQVDEATLSFADALRASLRQDPDVIMIGEIRDADVAHTAINAALTGHLVFSTLHTNSAAGAFPRLADLGIDPKVTGSAVNLVMGQRLIRTLGEGRGTPVPLEGALKKQMEMIVAGIPDTTDMPPIPQYIYHAENDDAYDNRRGVFEFATVDAELATFIRENPSVFDIEAHLRKTQRMNTLMEDGIIKVLKGKTTIAELERVIGPLPKN